MKVITTEKKPIKMWLDHIEDQALEQARNLANLPFTFKHVAIMPDSHMGYGMPIGGVLAIKGAVIPNAVGVDIGCGMCAVKTNINELSKESLEQIVSNIKKVIPLGFNHRKEPMKEWLAVDRKSVLSGSVIEENYSDSLYQIGTLGGGNHFIEIQKDTEGFIWFMIHSGSRNLGFKVAKHYNNLAIKHNELWHSSVLKEWQLAFLPFGIEDYHNYMDEMDSCVSFAFMNRRQIMFDVMDSFVDVIPVVEFENDINIAHNYASWENHYNTNVIVHRKGATSAKVGEIGIIPGSQGTKSYIVEGLGNKESFMSCSHGAGRLMGRKQAQKTLNLEDEIAKMGGVIHNIKKEKDLDESVGAYKDIDVVMENQKDLVKVLVELKPLAVIKG